MKKIRNNEITEPISHENKLTIILNLLLISHFLVLVEIWLKQYTNKEGYLNLLPIFSFRTYDPPFMVSGKSADPIIGFHTFGDWTQVIDNATLPTPYIPRSPSQTPPLGNWFLKVFFGWDTRIGFFLFVALAMFLWIIAINKIFKDRVNLTGKAIILMFAVIGNLGFLESFDRGSLHILVFGLIAFAYAFQNEQRVKKVGFFAVVIAISLKPQVSVIILWIIINRNWKLVLQVIFTTLMMNFFIMATFAGSVLENIKLFIRAIFFFGSGESAGYIFDGISITSILIRSYASRNSLNEAIQFLESNSNLAIIPGLLWLVFVVLLASFNLLHRSTLGILILSMTSLVVPASAYYTLTWMSLAWLVWLNMNLESLNRKISNFKEDLSFHFYREQLLTALTLLLVTMPLLKQYWNGWRYIPILKELHIVALIALPFFVLISRIFGDRARN